MGLGVMQVSVAHLHLYDSHFEMAEEFLFRSEMVCASMPLPTPWSVEDIEADPDGYVLAVREEASERPWPKFSPKPEVVT